MISIIICSIHDRIPPKLEDNIAATIGCDYELLCIDNSSNLYNIFQAYNRGVEMAKGDILCFMHDDILFLDQGWGLKVMHHLSEDVGVIGVIGNHLLPNCPASWWTTSLRSGNVIQRSRSDNRNINILFDKYRQPNLSYTDVVTVDGLWFCMPKSIFSQVKFDEDTYDGFHCYDTDICMQVLQCKLSIRAVFNIPIAHYSIGSLSKDFFQQRRLWYKKWEKKLPIWRGVELNSKELDLLNEMSELVNEQTEEKIWAEEDAQHLRNSYAYRIGKQLLKPFQWFKLK